MNIIAHLNWFDLVIMAIILLSIVISFFRGFLREAISLITWITGVLVALKFAPHASNLLPSFIHSTMLRFLIAFVALFLAVFILGFIVNFIIKRLIDMTGLSIVDRVVGIFFGSVRGLIAVGAILMFISVSPMQKAEWAKNSQLAPEFTPLVTWLDTYLPEKFRNVSQWVTGSVQKNVEKDVEKGV